MQTATTPALGLPHEVKASITYRLLQQGHRLQSNTGHALNLDGQIVTWAKAAEIAGIDPETGREVPSPESEVEYLRRCD